MDCKIVLSSVVLLLGFISLADCQAGPRNTSADTFIFTTVLTAPYIQMKTDPESGEEVFEGYLVDLLQHINMQLDLQKYMIKPVADGRYGAKDENGKWTGMIGELIAGEADAALAALSVTTKREEVVDFSGSFMEIGSSVLLRRDLNINSLEELLESEVSLGCIGSGRTQMVFREAKDGVLADMYSTMESQETDAFVNTMEEGIDRVLKEDYAMIGEDTMVQFSAANNCDLISFPLDAFPRHHQAIAFDKGSRYVSEFNSALLSLQEDGTLQQLYNEWWDLEECDNMADDSEGAPAEPESEPESEADDDVDSGADTKHYSSIVSAVISLIIALLVL